MASGVDQFLLKAIQEMSVIAWNLFRLLEKKVGVDICCYGPS
jgi:hypothetical protein